MTASDVLVIEDEPVVRAAVRRVLEAAGLRVAAADDAGSGLRHPDLDGCRMVVCDVMLPDASGMDVLRQVRARRPDLPVVLMTGYATPDLAVRAREAGAAAFLAKPFEASELLECVRRTLADPSVAQEERR
jgi:DNA-binding NtrC family response regulator